VKNIVLFMALAALALISLPMAPTARSAESDPIEAAVTAEMNASGVPGVVVIVSDDTTAIYERAFGVATADTPLTLEHVFRVGSITKWLTATAIADAAIRRDTPPLDAPIGKWDSAVPKDLQSLTMLQLLSQCSGLHDVAGEEGPTDARAADRLIAKLTRDAFVTPPDTAFSYSNLNYAIAGHALATATRQSYEKAMAKYVITPAGLRSTFFTRSALGDRPIASGHRGTKAQLTKVDPLIDDAGLRPAGYAYSTAGDLARLSRLFFASRPPTAAVLPGAVAEIMIPRCVVKTRVIRPVSGYALGLFTHRTDGHPWLEHEGQMPGFSASIAIIPDLNVSVVILANKEGVRLNEIRHAALWMAGVSETRASVPPAASARASFDDIEGDYWNRAPFHIDVDAARVVVTSGLFPGELPIAPIGRDLFSVGDTTPDGPVLLVLRDAHEQVTGVQFGVWTFCRAIGERCAR
jgi:CubicO group peptidase (beta-lactamase class C family)